MDDHECFEIDNDYGFVTVATGDEYYYLLASNLIKSFRANGNSNLPFAIVCDRENQYTKIFDKVVIIDNPHYSYLDKIELLLHLPYENNIFIDADSLVYNDVSHWVSYFDRVNTISAFGRIVPFNSNDGWFLPDKVWKYSEKICFVPSFHGGVYFIKRNMKMIKQIYNICKDVADNYKEFSFAYFDEPTDETCLSIAMATLNNKPVETNKCEILFAPIGKKNVKYDIAKRIMSYSDCGGIPVCHWSTQGTRFPQYKREVTLLKQKDDVFQCEVIRVGYKVFCLVDRLKRCLVYRLHLS